MAISAEKWVPNNIKELIFECDEPECDSFKATCYTFNEDEDRFLITIGPDLESFQDNSLYFLDRDKAKQLIDFLTAYLQADC